jgi:hypothetical protein
MISFSPCSNKPIYPVFLNPNEQMPFPPHYSCTQEAHLEFIIKVGESAVLFRPDEEEGAFELTDSAAGEDGKSTALFDGEVFGNSTS